MDEPASRLAKALSEYLDDNEKRQSGWRETQETHEKLLGSLQASIENLNIKLEELSKENASLKKELEICKKRDEQTDEEINKTRSNVDKLQNRLEDYESWHKLTSAIATQIRCLNEFRDSANHKFNEIDENQNKFAKQIKRQQSAVNPHRIPVKSPSASSYLNGNTHSSYSRMISPALHKNNLMRESPDVDDDISELSSHAEILKRGVVELNDLQRSFEKNSFLSDDDI